MKRAWVKYLLLGLWAYLMMLIITLPAHHAYSLALGQLGKPLPVTLHGIDGSLWNGRADTVAWRNKSLGSLDWELSPWQMLRGRLALQLQLQDADSNLGARVVVAHDGNTTLHDVDGRMSAAQLMRFNPGLPIAADGIVTLNLPQIRLPQDGAPIIEGTVVWSQALLIAGQPLKLGDLRLRLQPVEAGGTRGELADSGNGPLEINGTLTLDPNGTYRLEAQLRARPGDDLALGNSLQILGRADARGYHTLRYSGRL